MRLAAPTPAAPAPDPRSFRDALGRFATGVAFITAVPDGQPTGPSAGAPHRIGEHTRQVLGEVLGYDSARIEELAKAGAIGLV